MSDSHRGVVVTGLGVLTAFGRGVAPLAEGLRQGQSALAPLTAFAPQGLEIGMAAQVGVPLAIPEGFQDDRKAALALYSAN